MISTLFFSLFATGQAAYMYHETRLGGRLMQVSSARQSGTGAVDLFGVNEQRQIMTCRGPCDGYNNRWTPIPGTATHVSANEHEIYITLPDFTIKRCTRPCTDGQWQPFAGLLRQLSVNQNTLWGVNMNGDVFRTPIAVGAGPSWQNMAPGVKFQWVSVGADGEVWGVYDNGQLVRFNSYTSSWTPFSSTAKRVSVGERQIFAVDTNEILQHCERPCNVPLWNPVDPGANVKDVSAEWSGDKFYGLKSDYSVFEGEFTKMGDGNYGTRKNYGSGNNYGGGNNYGSGSNYGGGHYVPAQAW